MREDAASAARDGHVFVSPARRGGDTDGDRDRIQNQNQNQNQNGGGGAVIRPGRPGDANHHRPAPAPVNAPGFSPSPSPGPGVAAIKTRPPLASGATQAAPLTFTPNPSSPSAERSAAAGAAGPRDRDRGALGAALSFVPVDTAPPPGAASIDREGHSVLDVGPGFDEVYDRISGGDKNRKKNRGADDAFGPDNLGGGGSTRRVTGRARGTLDLTLLDARAHHGATTSGGGGVEPTPRAQFTSRTFSRGGGEDLVEAFSKARHGRVKDLAELFKSGVDPAARDINGLTLLHMAAQNNQRKATKLVLKHTDFATNPPRLDLIDAQTKQGHTALHYCFAYGYQDLGNYLLSLGADDTITNVHGMTCYEGLDPDEETRETLNNPEMRALARRKHMQRRVEAARPGATTPRIGPDRGDDFHRDGDDGRSRRSRAHEDAYGGWDGQGGRGGHPPHPSPRRPRDYDYDYSPHGHGHGYPPPHSPYSPSSPYGAPPPPSNYPAPYGGYSPLGFPGYHPGLAGAYGGQPGMDLNAAALHAMQQQQAMAAAAAMAAMQQQMQFTAAMGGMGGMGGPGMGPGMGQQGGAMGQGTAFSPTGPQNGAAPMSTNADSFMSDVIEPPSPIMGKRRSKASQDEAWERATAANERERRRHDGGGGGDGGGGDDDDGSDLNSSDDDAAGGVAGAGARAPASSKGSVDANYSSGGKKSTEGSTTSSKKPRERKQAGVDRAAAAAERLKSRRRQRHEREAREADLDREAAIRAAAMRKTGYHSSDSDSPTSASE